MVTKTQRESANKNIKEGDVVEVIINNIKHQGVILPKTEYNKKENVIIKLDSGYNISIDPEKVEIKKINTNKKTGSIKNKREREDKEEIGDLTIISAGGTIASKIEYETGGVVASYDVKDIIAKIPEMHKLFKKISSVFLFNEMSENLNPRHWEKIALKVREILDMDKERRIEGIIITHGTDTMHYTSAALSFALRDITLPMVLVGSQRSSDRPSSDAFMNLLAASHFIKYMHKKKLGGVYIVMHRTSDDTKLCAIKGVRTRKMHSSRRDAFKSINEEVFAEIDYDENKKEFKINIKESESNRRKIILKNEKTKYSKDIALIKVFPGMKATLLDNILKEVKGVVIEGTGMGHVSNIEEEEYNLVQIISKYINDKIIVMTTQTINGSTHEYVYKTLRKLKKMGVVFVKDMIAEVAYAKLCYLMGNINDNERIKELMKINWVGEMRETRKE